MVMVAEPAVRLVGPNRVDRRAADRRRNAAALLAAVTSGLAAARDTVFARERFEQVLRSLVQARLIALCDDPERGAGRRRDDVSGAGRRPAPSRADRGSVRTAAHARRWTSQLLDTATHVAGLILEIERAQRRSLAGRNRVNGAAPLICFSLAIRAVRDQIERVAATDLPSQQYAELFSDATVKVMYCYSLLDVSKLDAGMVRSCTQIKAVQDQWFGCE